MCVTDCNIMHERVSHRTFHDLDLHELDPRPVALISFISKCLEGSLLRSTGLHSKAVQISLSCTCSLQAAQLRGAMMPLIMVAFADTFSRSSTTSAINICMLHVLTGMRSRRVLRMWSAFLISSIRQYRTLLHGGPHRPRAVAATCDFGRIAWAA